MTLSFPLLHGSSPSGQNRGPTVVGLSEARRFLLDRKLKKHKTFSREHVHFRKKSSLLIC